MPTGEGLTMTACLQAGHLDTRRKVEWVYSNPLEQLCSGMLQEKRVLRCLPSCLCSGMPAPWSCRACHSVPSRTSSSASTRLPDPVSQDALTAGPRSVENDVAEPEGVRRDAYVRYRKCNLHYFGATYGRTHHVGTTECLIPRFSCLA